MLRSGSLFYELSMQLKDEMRQASQQQQQVQVGSEGANHQGCQDTSSSASKAAARRPFTLALDSDSDDDNNDDDSDATGAAAHRDNARDGAEHDDNGDDDEDNDILKEVRSFASSLPLHAAPSRSVVSYSPFRTHCSSLC